jgi:hypothetical protein
VAVTLQIMRGNIGQWAPVAADTWPADMTARFPVTPTLATSTAMEFNVPNFPLRTSFATTESYVIGANLAVVLSRGTEVVTSSQVLHVGRTPAPRKIDSVEDPLVAANAYNKYARIRIHGEGFDDTDGPNGYRGVIGGYFGIGTPGSATNRLMSVANRSHDYLELLLPADCRQRGLLMLSAGQPSGGGSETLIASSLTVECIPDIPKAYIVGTEPVFSISSPLAVQAGGAVNIRGTDLHVARFFDGANSSTALVSSAPVKVSATEEQVYVTLPAANHFYQILMRYPLYGHDAGSWVSGFAKTPP